VRRLKTVLVVVWALLLVLLVPSSAWAVSTYEPAVVADTPLAYYRLGEASGTSAADASGNSRSGTYTGSTYTLGAASLLASESTNTAVSFSGGRVAVSDAAWMDASAFTVEALVKPSTVAAGVGVIIARSNPTSYESFDLRRNGSDVVWRVMNTGFAYNTVTCSGALTADTKAHIMATHSGSVMKVYVNGTQCGGDVSASAPRNPSINEAMSIGALGNGSSSFAGTIDEAAYYGTALTEARADAHIAADAEPEPEPEPDPDPVLTCTEASPCVMTLEGQDDFEVATVVGLGVLVMIQLVGVIGSWGRRG